MLARVYKRLKKISTPALRLGSIFLAALASTAVTLLFAIQLTPLRSVSAQGCFTCVVFVLRPHQPPTTHPFNSCIFDSICVTTQDF